MFNYLQKTTASFREKVGQTDQAFMIDSAGVSSVFKTEDSNGPGAWRVDSSSTYREIGHSDWGMSLAYKSSAWAYRCVQTRMQAVSGMPHGIRNKITGKPITNHPLLQAFNDTYVYHGIDLLSLWEFALTVHGENYIEVISGGLFNPKRRLRWLNPIMIEPITDKGYIEGFFYGGPDASIPAQLSPEMIVYQHTMHPYDDFKGMGAMEVALDSVNIDVNIKRYTKAFFKNNARPGIIFSPEVGSSINPADEQRIQNWLNRRAKGVDRAFKPLLSPKPMRVFTIQPPSLEDQTILNERIRQEICVAFQVPMAIAGAWDVAKYQASPVQEQAMYRLLIIPECKKIAQSINVQLMPFFDPTDQSEFYFDFSSQTPLTDDEEKRSEMAVNLYTNQLLTRTEARAIMKLPPIKEEDKIDVYQPQSSSLQFSVGTPQQQMEQRIRAKLLKDSIEEAVYYEDKTDDVLDEIDQWWKRVKNGGVNKTFSCYSMPQELEGWIRSWLPDTDVKDVGHNFLVAKSYANALRIEADSSWKTYNVKYITIKEYDYFKSYRGNNGTRENFAADVSDLIIAASTSDVNRRRFGLVMRALINRHGMQAFRDGKERASGSGEELTPNDLKWINRTNTSQSAFVTNFANNIFKENITYEQAKANVETWANITLDPFFYEGLRRGAPDKRYRWKVGPTEHCSDCARLDGQIHSIDDWASSMLPRSHKLECGGWHCQCSLEHTVEDIKGDF